MGKGFRGENVYFFYSYNVPMIFEKAMNLSSVLKQIIIVKLQMEPLFSLHVAEVA